MNVQGGVASRSTPRNPFQANLAPNELAKQVKPTANIITLVDCLSVTKSD